MDAPDLSNLLSLSKTKITFHGADDKNGSSPWPRVPGFQPATRFTEATSSLTVQCLRLPSENPTMRKTTVLDRPTTTRLSRRAWSGCSWSTTSRSWPRSATAISSSTRQSGFDRMSSSKSFHAGAERPRRAGPAESRTRRQQGRRVDDAQRCGSRHASHARRRGRLSPERIGRRGTGERHQSGAAGPFLLDAGPDPGGDGPAGGPASVQARADDTATGGVAPDSSKAGG